MRTDPLSSVHNWDWSLYIEYTKLYAVPIGYIQLLDQSKELEH